MSVYVREDGCVRLGKCVTCDGFSPEARIRIQSHAHSDHLGHFAESKGNQEKIVMSEATKQLLVAENHFDLDLRERQVVVLPLDGKYRKVLGVEVALFPSSHMIGSAIAAIKVKDKHYAYTGDIGGQIELFPVNPDVLVVDATYGNPKFRREYNKDEVAARFIEIARGMARKESLAIVGYRGRLQHATQMLAELNERVAFLFSQYVAKTLDIFMRHNAFEIRRGYVIGTSEGNEIMSGGGKYIAFIDARDSRLLEQIRPARKIILSAYMVPRTDPVFESDNGNFRIALTDHADFNETIALISKIRPKKVIADGTRCGDADALAEYVSRDLSICASSEVVKVGRMWGGMTTLSS